MARLQGNKVNRRKKIIRSLAFDESVLQQLHEAANRKRVSVNALVMEIIEYYLIMGIRAEDVGLIHFALPTFKRFLKHFEFDKVFYEEAMKSNASAWEEWVILMGTERDLPSFLRMVKFYESIGYAKVSITESPTDNKIILIHDLGPSWSKYLEIRLRGGYRYMTGKTLPDDAVTLLSNGLSVKL